MHTPIIKKCQEMIRKLIDDICKGTAFVGMWLMVILALVILSGIVARVIGYPLEGTFETSELVLCVSVFLPMAYTWMAKRHVRVDFFLIRFPAKIKTTMEIPISLLGTFLFSLLTWRNLVAGFFKFKMGDITETISIPIFPIYFAITLGCGLLTIQMLISAWENILKITKKEYD